MTIAVCAVQCMNRWPADRDQLSTRVTEMTSSADSPKTRKCRDRIEEAVKNEPEIPVFLTFYKYLEHNFFFIIFIIFHYINISQTIGISLTIVSSL